MSSVRGRVLSATAGVVLVAGFVGTMSRSDALAGENDLSALIEKKLNPAAAADKPGASSVLPRTEAEAMGMGTRMALGGIAVAAILFGAALMVKRGRERRMGDILGSHLTVKESVMVGRGQRILLVTFDDHKVLVGVSGGALHNLGVFGEKGQAAVPPSNPIEREAAKRSKPAVERGGAEFADFVKGELAGTLQDKSGAKDPRQRMLYELNSL